MTKSNIAENFIKAFKELNKEEKELFVDVYNKSEYAKDSDDIDAELIEFRIRSTIGKDDNPNTQYENAIKLIINIEKSAHGNFSPPDAKKINPVLFKIKDAIESHDKHPTQNR